MRYRWDPVYPAYPRRTPQNAGQDVRASDAERNEVADKLARHFADGRLDQAEFKTRLDRAMGAVTRRDLDGLFHDLPRLSDDPQPPRPRRRLFLPVAVFLVVAALAIGPTISVVHVPWLVLVLVGLLLWHRAHRHRIGYRAPSEPHR